VIHVAIITRRFLYLFKAEHSKINIPKEQRIITQNLIVLKSEKTVSFDKIDLQPKDGAIMVNIPEPDKYIKCEEVTMQVLHDQGSFYHDALYNGRSVDKLQMLLHFGVRWIFARSCGRKWKCRDGRTKSVEIDRPHLVDVKYYHCLFSLIAAFSSRTYQLAANSLSVWYANFYMFPSNVPPTQLVV